MHLNVKRFRILKNDPYDRSVLPLHISLLSVLNLKNALFQLSHVLSEQFPADWLSSFAIGSYYLMLKKYEDARRHYSRSTTINPLFAHAWLGFAHAFALDGEHDQAISAYSTAARLFKG